MKKELKESIAFLELLMTSTPDEAHDILINNGDNVLDYLKKALKKKGKK